jgi:hypothetical protein
MSSDPKDRTPAQVADEADVSDDMKDKLDRLDEHIGDAQKKAGAGRPHGDSPSDDDVIDDLAGGGTDHDEHVDDPEGPLVAE